MGYVALTFSLWASLKDWGMCSISVVNNRSSKYQQREEGIHLTGGKELWREQHEMLKRDCLHISTCLDMEKKVSREYS